MNHREFEVEENTLWHGVSISISKLSGAAKVVDSMLPIDRNVNRRLQPGLGHGLQEEVGIIWIVLNKKDTESGRFHCKPGNSIQNADPCSPSDSTPVRPPIFSTALRTMARPMPVPS